MPSQFLLVPFNGSNIEQLVTVLYETTLQFLLQLTGAVSHSSRCQREVEMGENDFLGTCGTAFL